MFLVQGNWRGGRLYPILQFPALGLMQLLKLQYTEKMSRFRSHHCTARRTKVTGLPLNSDIRESMIIALSCAADLPASRETLISFSSSSFARVQKISC